MTKKLWKPKNPKSITTVKLALWAGILVWMIFFFAFGLSMAFKIAHSEIILWGFGSDLFAKVLQQWVAPIWIVFTALMVCIYVARFVHRKLRSKDAEDDR